MLDNTQPYQLKIEAKLEQMRADLGKARAQAKEQAADVGMDVQDKLNSIEERLSIATKQLEDLQESSSETADQLYKNLEQSVDEIRNDTKDILDDILPDWEEEQNKTASV